jgi:hypothetical protein
LSNCGLDPGAATVQDVNDRGGLDMNGRTIAGLCAGLAVAALATVPAAVAKDGDVLVAGTCSAASTSKL